MKASGKVLKYDLYLGSDIHGMVCKEWASLAEAYLQKKSHSSPAS